MRWEIRCQGRAGFKCHSLCPFCSREKWNSWQADDIHYRRRIHFLCSLWSLKKGILYFDTESLRPEGRSIHWNQSLLSLTCFSESANSRLMCRPLLTSKPLDDGHLTCFRLFWSRCPTKDEGMYGRTVTLASICHVCRQLLVWAGYYCGQPRTSYPRRHRYLRVI